MCEVGCVRWEVCEVGCVRWDCVKQECEGGCIVSYR